MAAPETSISRAAAPALRRLSYEVRTLPLPPVSCSPYFGSRSACTTWTPRQSQQNSSATIIGSDVRTPCPISDLPHQIFTSPLGDTSSQAFGEKELDAREAEKWRAREFPGRRKGRRRAAPAAAEDFRKTRRGTIADMNTAPENQTRRGPVCEQPQLPSTGAVAGLRGALEGCGGASGSTPRQPTGRPLTASFTERKSTTYINWR